MAQRYRTTKAHKDRGSRIEDRGSIIQLLSSILYPLSSFSLRVLVSWWWILFLGLPSVSLPAVLTPQEALAPGAPIERELKGGEAHAYRVTLAVGFYLYAVVEQRGIDVVVRLIGPKGQQLMEMDSPNGPQGAEILFLELTASGDYRLEVRALEPDAAPGRYAVRIEELQDASRIAAEKNFAEAERARAQQPTEAGHQAIEKYQAALELFRSVGNRHREADTLYLIGRVYDALGEQPHAREYYGQARLLQHAAGDRWGEAASLFYMGTVSYAMGEPEKSLEYCLQALTLRQAVGDRHGEGRTHHIIGLVYDSLGEPQKALHHYAQALMIRRALGERWREAVTLNNLAAVYDSIGEKQKALEHYDQSLQLSRALKDRANEAMTLTNIGLVYWSLGETQQGLDYYRQALALNRAVGARQGEANTLANIGLAYWSLGSTPKALDYFGQALPLWRAVGDPYGEVRTLNNLGYVYNFLGQRQKALGYFEQALATTRAVKDRPGEARTLDNIGLVYAKGGQPPKALDYLSQALRLRRAVGDRSGEADTLTNLGLVYADLSEDEKTLDHFGQALPLRRAVGDRSGEASTLAGLARVERNRGQLTQALTHIQAALDIIESLRNKVVSQDLRASYLASKQTQYEFYIDLLMRRHQRQPSAGHNATPPQTPDRPRARTLLELLAEARIDVQQGIEPGLKQKEQALQARISWIQGQLIKVQSQASPDKSKIATLEEDLKKLETEREGLEQEIRQKHPRYAALQYPTPLGLKAIQGLLDEDTALLQYALGDESSFLFVVSQNDLQSFRLPTAGEITRWVQEVRTRLGQPGRRKFASFVKSARQLYEMLIAPAADRLARKRNLLIAPDDELYYLPFESLLTADASEKGPADYRQLAYLVKRWAVGYVPSASVLASLRQNRSGAEDRSGRAASKEFVAFADPIYEPGGKTQDATSKTPEQKANTEPTPQNPVQEIVRSVFEEEGRWELRQLTDSSQEVTGIARLYEPDEVAVYLGSAAKEENVKGNADLSTARRIHFATHGLISERQPQYSGLVLTLDNDPHEDGLLQVFEIFNLKLNAELVVLSACRTGLGKEVKGEGLVGLTRAFMYAGAPSVVVSLWEVADRSTAELMVKFYQQLDRASAKAEALRRAKLELIQSGRFAHPYYWAPFILVGEPK